MFSWYSDGCFKYLVFDGLGCSRDCGCWVYGVYGGLCCCVVFGLIWCAGYLVCDVVVLLICLVDGVF